MVGGVRTTISTSELRLAQKRIEVEEENRKGVQEKREVASDSLQSIQLKILDLESMEGVSSELGPLEYLSGLLNKPMDQIINWCILIIIFVFDPLAVALVIAFNNAVKVDRGIVDKQKVIRKRELYDEVPEEDEDDGMWTEEEMEDFRNQFDDVVPEEEVMKELEVESEQVLPDEARGTTPPTEEFDEADLNKDGEVTEEEQRDYYETTGWKNAHNGNPYFTHPWFDWSKRERWINDRMAINYWIRNQGGTQGQLEQIKENYPTDFSKKTY